MIIRDAHTSGAWDTSHGPIGAALVRQLLSRLALTDQHHPFIAPAKHRAQLRLRTSTVQQYSLRPLAGRRKKHTHTPEKNVLLASFSTTPPTLFAGASTVPCPLHLDISTI